jgi:shikimate kinase
MSVLPATTDFNLILTGSIGPSQLIVARRVADRLKVRFVDVEQELERRAEMLLEDFRTLFGDARLRALESEVISDLALYRGSVIHINGQFLAHSDHLARIANSGYVLCLVASLDAVLTRLHIALGARYHNPSARTLAIGALQRDWAIRGKPNVHEFDTTHMSDAEIVDTIVNLWVQQVIEFTRV